MSFNDSADRRPADLVLVLADLAGYAKAAADHDDAIMARLIDQYYGKCVEALGGRNGRVVKFMGDACHAVFAGDAGSDAVDAVLRLRRATAVLAERYDLALQLGANVHRGVVVEGQYGPEGYAQYDVIGVAMNETAMMGRGPGVRISEPVYRQLVGPAREPWRLDESSGVFQYHAA